MFKPPRLENHRLTFNRLLFYAVCLGIGIGCLATIYYFLLQWGLQTLWTTLPTALQWNPAKFQRFAWIFTTIGGFLVGLSVHYLGAPSGINTAIDEIHNEGRIDYRKTPGMIVASLLSLIFGSSAGPESPLVDINGSIGSWFSDKLKLSQGNTRVLTFCGMGAALGAFFGSPLGSAILALELPHRFGLEYYEALIPVMVSTVISFAIFRSCTGRTIGGFYEFHSYPAFHPSHLIFAVLLGMIGAAAATLFIFIFSRTQHFIQAVPIHPILLTTLGGLGIGLIAGVFPLTLFYGEREIQIIIDTGAQVGWKLLLLSAIAKMIAVSLCLHCGFRGGYIFALFFIGASIGMGVSLLVPYVPPSVAMLCMMAAVTVAVMKTPVSIPVILSVISNTDLIPMITVATIVSFLLTMKISLIPTQRARNSVPETPF
ncbi:chloride channel protein [Phormidium sp. LEGE 05292]|uniref:chloride channel protein n=1 Tax=[Phormidium] sp. LEGE 05292 TaxID=767427 RepID=UPI0018817EB8|nr:chloride channel protein [Phormidium sp. LEGE 05292]MBE9229598.1 chloride channel protein [Phormidium sp. LEGE 05292]